MPDERWARVDIKTLNLIPNILAQTKAEKKGAYTAILVRDGIVTEGATSNVFVMKDGVCYTHPANHHILKGITRQLVVTRVAPTAGITIIEREFDEAFLKDADEIFFTDTIGGIIPITTLNREPVGDGKPGKAAKVLAEQLQHLMEEGLA